MAEAFVTKLSWNDITEPSTVAGYLTASTSTTALGADVFGLLMTTAIPAEIEVDPADQVGFVFFVSNTSTFAEANLTLAAGEGWQGIADKTFTVGENTSSNLMYFIGPVESAKYVRYDSTTVGVGTPCVKFTLTTGVGAAPAGRIVAFKMPTVEYAT
jgi:hypothetical protein